MKNIISQSTTKSGKTVSFRYPTINDAEILMNYINKISLEKTFITFQGEQQTLKEETKWLKSFIEKINKSELVFLMAFIGGNLVATSHIELKDKIKSHIGGFGITVSKDYRGDGIGKKLMELVISESIKKIKGLKIIELEVFGDNPIAQNLYKKMGFIEFGRLPRGIKHKDKFVDAVLMYKNLK